MPRVALECPDYLRGREASVLLRELHDAHDAVRQCLRDLDKVLAGQSLDASALTSVRLRLAGVRLTRGPLITRASEFLSGHVTAAEKAMLENLRSSHLELLQAATIHTAKWTLESISRNWTQYRRETRDLVRKWEAKAEHEQRFVHPLIERCAGNVHRSFDGGQETRGPCAETIGRRE